MLNKPNSHSEYTIQDKVTQYPVGFEFFFNGDDTPQVLVKIGGVKMDLNVHYKFSEDLSTLVLIPLEEEKPTDPNDYSWMNKWLGQQLEIERDIEFVQESDYQVGRISPEQIEKDFDASVMRDQILLDKIGEHTTDVSEELESLHTDISDINAELATKATKAELDNYKLTANAAIDANATAIQKTREDYIQADSEIHQILNSHTNELTTLRGNQASLGDQVAGIEQKIPESASGSNPLITKQQLLDEEMDIRKDLNEGLGELQTQITAQAAEIATKQDKLTAGDNIVISGNVISATGAGGGAGFDMQVVDQLPATGKKGVIYLVPKDGAAPDVYDEYVWIDATQTFELIGTTQVDLSGYLPLSGGTLTGPLTITAEKTDYSFEASPFLKAIKETKDGSSKKEFRILISSVGFNLDGSMIDGVSDVRPKSNNLCNIGDSLLKWKSVYTTKLNNGADIAIPTEGGTLARLEDLENIDALPDQTGNTGKFLMTNGATASWSDKPLVNSAVSPSFSLGIVGTATGVFSTATGVGSSANNGGTAYGYNSKASVAYGVAVGQYAQTTNAYSIQIGKGTNSDTNTFKVGNQNGNYEIMSADGTIPAERMSATAGTTGQVLTKTDAGMNWQDAAGGAKIIIRRGI